jgi:carbon monoxide dehydrogenase subunit G
MGTVRRQIEIDRPADDVWALVGDPTTIDQWFPGIVDCTVDGTIRTITTNSGLPIPEEIVTIDAIQRRFQYRVTAGFVQHHLGTIDVFALDDGHTLVSYSTDAEPDAMALIIGGATGAALAEIRRQLELDRSAPGPTPEPGEA